jgi:hypothetical protein
MINPLPLLKLVPKQIWFILGALALYMGSLYYVKGLGYSEGYSKAQIELNKASQKLLQQDLRSINSTLSDILSKRERDSEAIQKLSQSISGVQQSTDKYKELLEDAKNSATSTDCILSDEYIRLFQSIYSTQD